MSRWTERQLAAALAWLSEQWNRPSRADHYAMQTALEVRRAFTKEPEKVDPASFVIPFKEKVPPTAASAAVTAAHRLAAAKAGWAASLGMGRRPTRGNRA